MTVGGDDENCYPPKMLTHLLSFFRWPADSEENHTEGQVKIEGAFPIPNFPSFPTSKKRERQIFAIYLRAIS